MTTVHSSSKRATLSLRAAPAARGARGFTMTELAVTMAVAALLATLAVPSFNGIIASQRARTFASALYASLAKTRSQALTLNNNVTLQAKPGGWTSGWQILDANNNVLDDYSAAPGVTVGTPAPAPIVFRASGRLPAGALAPVFQISTGSGGAANHQCVSVDLSGRPYMQAASAC